MTTTEPITTDSRHPVFALSDRFVDELAERSPMTATQLGLPGYNDRWDDTSPGGRVAYGAFLAGQRAALAGLPPAEDTWAKLAVRVFGEHLDLELERLDEGDHLRDMGHLQGLFPQIRETFDQMNATTVEGWHDIARRLATIGEPLAGWRDCLAEGMAADLWAARRQVESTIRQLRAAGGPEGAFTVMVERFRGSGIDDDDGVEAELHVALDVAREDLAEAATWLEQEYLPGAPEADGVGEERYRRCARGFLGTELDLLDTYRWGWDHLQEIRTEMEALAAEIDPSTDLAGVIAGLEADPDRSATSQEEFRNLMLDRQRRAMDELADVHFDIPDQIRPIDVRMAPLGAALGAYFIPPSEDFTRPGTTWWSLGSQQTVPLWGEVTTAYHEGFPGHHLQCGIQTCLGDRLSRVHRLLFWLSGYGEGWALYAERLMRELGYLDQPEFVLGLLASNALRAVRVVIDIGSHLELPIPDDVAFHPGEAWTFDLAVEALDCYTFQAHELSISEVTRYLGWPGQAISYKVGERAILALRDECRERDGDAFDLKDFHARVLGSGPVGLDHLRDIVLATG